MSKIGTIADILRYLAEDAHSIHYTGWVGYRNLGDEILLEAAQQCFAPARIVWIKDFHDKRMRALISRKRHELAMLGGGTQIGEHSPLERFRRALAASKSGFVFGAGVTPCTEGPVPPWLEQWGEVLRPLPYVGVRGPESAATLKRVGVAAQVLGDPVCWFARPTDFWLPQDGLIGINVGHSHGHMYGQESEIQRQLAELVRGLAARGHRFEFFCVWPEDLETTRRIAAEAGIARPVIHEIYDGAMRFQEAVRRMQVFIGIKLHAVALAMCSSVPSLMIEYRPKCREFAATMGAEDYCVRSDALDVGQMLALVDDLRTRGAAQAATMRQHALEIRGRLESLSRSLLSTHGW
ncbi:MAG TPA: polysaccharide pyruvyl transferase family protein [Burkholderiaceae bacterium]